MDSVLGVPQLNRYVKSVVDSDFRLKDLMLRLFPEAVGVFSSVGRPVPIANANTPLLTVCLVMMSALLLIQTQPLIQKGARHFQRKER